jgi:predicted amidohydrolase
MAQIEQVYWDLDATIAKVCKFVDAAGKNGVQLLSFPEGVVSGYPWFNWWTNTFSLSANKKIGAMFVDSSPLIVSPQFDVVLKCIREAGVNVVLPINERDPDGSKSAVFNTAVFIDKYGKVLGRHRKGLPSFTERFWWTHGDQSDLVVVDMPGVGKVCALLCWECWVVLARYTLLARGCEFFFAPTQDLGASWSAHVKAMARDGGVYVVSGGQMFRPGVAALSDLAVESAAIEKNQTLATWVERMMASANINKPPGMDMQQFYQMDGGAAIAEPTGKTVAGPVFSMSYACFGMPGCSCDQLSSKWAREGCPGMDSGKACKVVEVPGLADAGPPPYVPGAEFILTAVAERSLLVKQKAISENVGSSRPHGLFKFTYNNRKGEYLQRVSSSAGMGSALMYTTGQAWSEFST